MSLDTLDFSPRCECGNHAVSFLEIHALDYCTEDYPTRSSLLCRACLQRDVGRLAGILVDHPDFCSSCHLTFVSLSDIVVRLSPLEKVSH